jgi:hypothetical protein
MDLFTLLFLLALAAYGLNWRDQKKRIALLGSQLGQYQIESLMEQLTQGYLRALGEDDAQRRAQIWNLLSTTEMALCEQFNRFVAEFDQVPQAEARVSKLPFFPLIRLLLPGLTFDLRQVLHIHAQGITRAAENRLNLPLKNKAFILSAELFLMQHSCHWFCRSKPVASARMLMRHQTSYAQLIAAVSAETREAYGALTAL